MAHLSFLDNIHDARAFFEQSAAANKETHSYPFLQYEFLAALEDSGSVGSDSGWDVCHAVLHEGDTSDSSIIAFCPLYKKSDSYGEYVFDHAWAQAYYQHGLNYYPKWVNAIPFSPVTGPRAVGAIDAIQTLYQYLDAHLQQAMQEALEAAAKLTTQGDAYAEGIASHISGLHILFPNQALTGTLDTLNFAIRKNVNFQWFNRDYHAFDDFLDAFSSRKRKNTRKERAKILDSGITLERLTGDAISPKAWSAFLVFYQQTYLKRSGHTGYLTEDFFHRLYASPLKDQLLLVMAVKDDQYIGGALYFYDDDCLYGRYWGCTEEAKFLHFEACYYQGIEFCIERGLQRFDPGVQGEHKLQRGFEPVYTYSYHKLSLPPFQQAIQRFVTEEAKHHEAYLKQARTYLPFKKE